MNSMLPVRDLGSENLIQKYIDEAQNEFSPRGQRLFLGRVLEPISQEIEARRVKVPGDLLYAIERVRGLREEFGESYFQGAFNSLNARIVQRSPSYHRTLRNYFNQAAKDRAIPFLSPLPERAEGASTAFRERVQMIAEEMYEDPTHSEYAIQVVAHRILSMERRLGSKEDQSIREAFAGNLRDFRLLKNQRKIDAQMNKAKELARGGLEKEGKCARDVECYKAWRSNRPPVDLGRITGTLGNGAGIAHFQGDRPEMEDTHLTGKITYSRDGIAHTAEVYAIFDGHAGLASAVFARGNLLRYLGHHLSLQKDPKLLEEGNTFNALKFAMVDLSEACKRQEGLSGATSAIVIKLDEKLLVANVGDSRVLINSSRQGLIQATEDAEPTGEHFRDSVKKRGGEIHNDRVAALERVGGLAVARALGDSDVPGVTARPKITCFDLKELGDSQVIIGCDGIFEVESSRTVLERAKRLKQNRMNPAEIAAELVKAAYGSVSTDNLSAMVINVPR